MKNTLVQQIKQYLEIGEYHHRLVIKRCFFRLASYTYNSQFIVPNSISYRKSILYTYLTLPLN